MSRKIPLETRICECGCYKTFTCEVNSTQKYLHGHNRRGKHDSPETTKRRSEAQTKKKVEVICKQCGEVFEAHLYRIKTVKFCSIKCKANYQKTLSTWNKGLTKETDERVAKMTVFTQRSQKKLRQDPKWVEQTNRNNSLAQLVNWQDPLYKERILKAQSAGRQVKPNKPETILLNLLQTLFPDEYKFVGDGEIWFGGKNPDFINVNGQKKIIELFGDYWHSKEVQGVPEEQHVSKRRNVFKKYGYKTLVIWERELDDIKNVSNKILEFNLVEYR